MKIKICGITNPEDADAAVKSGADYIGFIFAESKRKIDVHTCADILKNLNKQKVLTVGVFMNQSFDIIKKIDEKCNFDIIQLHGTENVSEYYRTFNKPLIKRITDLNELNKTFFKKNTILLFDKTLSENEIFDIRNIDSLDINNPVMIAGGLNCGNISEILNSINNVYAVDAASGIEKFPGKKDLILMKNFIETIRKYYE